MKLCIVTAVDLEFNAAAKLLQQKSLTFENRLKLGYGTIGDQQVAVLQSQMGAVGFDSLLAGHLSASRYDALLITGLAGALAPELGAGDAVVYEQCRLFSNLREKPTLCEEKASIACDPKLSRFVLETLRAAGFPCVSGVGVTVPSIMTEATQKIELGRDYASVAVDMETYQVLAVCDDFKLPAAVLRVISDEATTNIPDFNRAHRANGELDGFRLAQAMAARPLDSLRFLLSLRRATNALKRDLAAVLHAKWCDQ